MVTTWAAGLTRWLRKYGPVIDILHDEAIMDHMDNKGNKMTVRELREILFDMDQDLEVTVWKPEWDQTDPIRSVELCESEVVIF